MQGNELSRALVAEIAALARKNGKRAVRLDILGTNGAAERLYSGAGFRVIQAKPMYYEDAGLTEYKLPELAL